MSEELKACPFCGGEAYIEKKWNGKSPIIKSDDYQYFAVCRSCACEGPWRKTEGNAIREWNTRPIEDALTAERDALKAENEKMREALGKIDARCSAYGDRSLHQLFTAGPIDEIGKIARAALEK